MRFTNPPWYFQVYYVRIILGANLIGSAYGFYWYKNQLVATPYIYWPFTPDCPLYTLLFSFLLIRELLNSKAEYIKPKGDIFSIIVYFGLIKYGVWTIFVLLSALTYPGIQWILGDYLLFISHGGMLIQGVLFLPKKELSPHLIHLTGLWFVFNDYIDYFHGVYPSLPVPEHLPVVQLFAFLSTGLLWFVFLWIGKIKQLHLNGLD